METKLNFSWSKKSKDSEKVVGEQNVLTNKKRIVDDGEQVDFITNIEENTITSTKPTRKKEEIVIPLIQSKYQPLKIKPKMPPSGSAEIEVKDELKKQAMEEIIQESKELGEKNEENIVIPMTESNVDNDEVEMEVADADYEAVPVANFGLAALRGMGSKQEIDARLPVAPPMPVRRSKGLGLGAVLEKDEGKARGPKKEVKGEEEELVLKGGARCRITGGRMKGRYGTVESVDGNTDRVIVKLAASGQSAITVPSVMMLPVTEKEFKKYSKYLNRDTAEAFKSKDEERMLKEREKDRVWREEERRRQRREEKERAGERDKERAKEKERQRRQEKESAAPTKRAKISNNTSWVRPRLRVRLVDKNYRDGRYFKEKLVVMDVPSPHLCVCQTDSRRILDDVSSKMLETVIPRGERATVMVLRGDFQGELAEIVDRDKDRCRAVVQMANEKSLETYDYDDLCEFVG